MNFAEGPGQITINPHDKRDSRDSRNGAAHSAGVADGNQERGEHAEKSDSEHGGAERNRLEDTALGIHLIAGHQRQHRSRRWRRSWLRSRTPRAAESAAGLEFPRSSRKPARVP